MGNLAYIPYLSLSYWTISFLCTLIAIYNWSKVLKFVYESRKLPDHLRLSSILVVYVLNAFCYSFLMLFHSGYMTFMWRPENSYNAYLIFWTFMPCFAFIMANPVAVFYLAIEWCIIISFPVQYNKTQQKILIKITLFTISLVSFIFVFLYSLDYPQRSKTACWAPGCLFALRTTNIYRYVILAFAALIMISSAYFVYLSKKYSKSNLAQAANLNNQTSQKRNNSLVIYTICIEFVFNFIPYIAASIANWILDTNVNLYIGPYIVFLLAIEGCLCSIAFTSTLLKKEKVVIINSYQNNFVGS